MQLIGVRLRFGLAALVTVLIGLGSRRIDAVPAWVGDLLWASVVFLGLSAVFPALSWLIRVGGALLLSYLVEVSQLYRAPWLDSFRDSTVGHLLLGSTFYWGDLAAYTVGVLLAAGATRSWRVRAITEAGRPGTALPW